jgi:hypothetical protein
MKSKKKTTKNINPKIKKKEKKKKKPNTLEKFNRKRLQT